eukprot:scaffold269_cov404-Prasinococcus_capsulatus_cf.AAC.35
MVSAGAPPLLAHPAPRAPKLPCGALLYVSDVPGSGAGARWCDGEGPRAPPLLCASRSGGGGGFAARRPGAAPSKMVEDHHLR